jgi:putative transcriptional regulator
MVESVVEENSQELLLEYAAGVLDDARRFMIDAHLRMSERCREDVDLCEKLGGYLLSKDCEYAQMKDTSRDRMMGMLDACLSEGDVSGSAHDNQCMQTVAMLKSMGLSGQLIEHLEQSCRVGCVPSNWSGLLNQKIKYLNINAACKKSTIRLVRIAAGTNVPAHGHNGDELTLILAGQMMDEYGSYNAGDLVIRRDGQIHAPQIGTAEDCVCLALTYNPVVMKNPVVRVLNIFYRF